MTLHNIFKLQYESTKKGDVIDNQFSYEKDLLQQLLLDKPATYPMNY